MGTLAGAVLNYTYQRLMAGMLGSSDYGELVAIISLLVVLSVPASVVQTLAIRRSGEITCVEGRIGSRVFLEWLLKKIWPIGLIMAVLVAVFAHPLANFLRLDSSAPILFMIIPVGLGLMTPAVRGVLQGEKEFLWQSGSSLIEGLTKVAFGVLLVYMGYRLYGALGALVISVILTLGFTLIPYRRRPKGEVKTDYTIPWREYLELGVVFLVLNVLFTADILLVKNRFSADLAGQYSAVSQVAKYLFYFSSPAIGAMFPLAAERRSKGQSSLPIFSASLAMIFGLSFLGVIIFFAAPELIMKILFGAAYTSMSSILPKTGIMVGLYGMLFLITQYQLIRRRNNFVWLLLIALPLLFWVWQRPGDINNVINHLIIILLTMNGVLALFGLIDRRRQK